MEEQSIPQHAGDKRNAGIDLFRGLLVILVILGHYSELTQRHSFLTWLGVGFRMPLFIGLTGYLFNLEHARSLSTALLFDKYYGRLILPWLAACAVTLTITGALTWAAPFSILVRPPFHLWFVPVMLAFIFIARACRLSPTAMLLIAFPTSIAAMYVFGVGHEVKQFAAWIPDRRYFIYPVYFAFGVWVARRPFDPAILASALIASMGGLAWWCRLYDHPALPAEVAAELLLCIPLIWLFPWIRGWTLRIPLLAGIGRDSLFFYLWHPLAFGLLTLLGVSGLPLLALWLVSMCLAWSLIARLPRLSVVLGVRPMASRAGKAGAFAAASPGAIL